MSEANPRPGMTAREAADYIGRVLAPGCNPSEDASQQVLADAFTSGLLCGMARAEAGRNETPVILSLHALQAHHAVRHALYRDLEQRIRDIRRKGSGIFLDKEAGVGIDGVLEKLEELK